jgi:hypothetical protein
MLLYVMFGTRTWRVQSGETFTFGRSPTCSMRTPDHDRGVSRSAGSLSFHDGTWWLRNDSKSSLLFVTGDRGFRVDLPPGMQIPVQQWHAKIRLNGVLGDYTLRLRIPDLDEVDDAEEANEPTAETSERLVTSTRYRARLTKTDRIVLAARFEDYLTWRHAGPAAPRTAKETADRIGWQPHTVAKRCENIRDRYSRLGVPGLRGPRALEELATLLISTGELTARDLRLLPGAAPSGSPGAPSSAAEASPASAEAPPA